MSHDKKSSIAFFGLKGIPSQGGTAAVGENIIRQLHEHYNITVYATSTHATKKEPIIGIRQIIIKALPIKKLNVFYYNLMSAFHALIFGRYTLVHTHQIDIAFIIPLLRLRYKVVATHHGKTYEIDKWGKTMKRFFRWSERLMLRKANQVTFVADTERRDIMAEYPGNYLHIPNGIKRPVESGEPQRKEYIMFAAGRLIPHKGCHVFLNAMKRLNYEGKIVIAGNYDTNPEYRQRLLEYKTDLNIDFKGMITNQAELNKLVREARLFVFPSFYEAMSMMLLEVAAEKTPLVCSDIRENTAIFDSSEALFFKTGDDEDLALKIDEALHHSEAATIRAENAYQKLMATFTWDIIARQYRSVYEKLIQK